MTNSEMMHFRATPELADALAKAAEREGVSQSEIIRRAVSGRLGCEVTEPAAIDPFILLGRAARGELQAQRDLARQALSVAFERNAQGELENDPLIGLSEALIFARLAAAHGDATDQGLVISLLALFIEQGGENLGAGAELLARLELAANLGASGSEEAAQAIPDLVEQAGPAVTALAGSYLKRIKQGAE